MSGVVAEKRGLVASPYQARPIGLAENSCYQARDSKTEIACDTQQIANFHTVFFYLLGIVFGGDGIDTTDAV
jgi:microcystin-dependent protein